MSAAVLLAGCEAVGSEAAPSIQADERPAGTAPQASGQESQPSGPETFVVAYVVDGDTLELRDGQRVRLVQIDAPEPAEEECYSRKATAALRSLVSEGSRVGLVSDPALDDEDRFGRLLRYVFAGGKNVNLELVRRGAASVWFVGGEGRYASELMRAAEQAEDGGLGLWGACPGTILDPRRGVATSQS